MSSSGLAIHLSKLLEREAFQKCREITYQMFQKYLFLTNVGLSATFSLTGDVLQQYYEFFQNKNRRFDKDRAFKMTVAGVAVGGFCHFWYKYLDKKMPGTAWKIVAKKVAIDQLVCSPIYISIFFATTSIVEKASWEDFKQEMIHKWWRLYLAEWVIWPPAQVVNFYLVPPKYRVLYDNVVSLGYDVFTSYVKNEIPVGKQSHENDSSEKDK